MDLQLDLFVMNFELENNSLLRFSAWEYPALNHFEWLGSAGFQYVGFGTALADFDAYGWKDSICPQMETLFYQTGQTADLNLRCSTKIIRGDLQMSHPIGWQLFAAHADADLQSVMDSYCTLDFVGVDQEKPPTIGF